MSRTYKYGAVILGQAYYVLEQLFGPEWINVEDGQKEVAEDFLTASIEDSVTPAEYKRRIGEGNLQSYAHTLLVQKQREEDANEPN